MIIKKVLNNNVIQTKNSQGDEVIVMGRGIAFQCKVGETIDETLVEKTFLLQEQDRMFTDIYRQLSPEEIEIVFSIIKRAEEELNQKFLSHIYLTLGDHLHYVLQRHKTHLPLTNPLMWEVKRSYKKEYKIGLKALAIVEEKLGVRLDEMEAASIAIHLINAQKDGQMMEQTIQMLYIIQNILSIVRIHYGLSFDKESLFYMRFVTHLQYFAQQIINRTINYSEDSFLYEQVKVSYPSAFKCSTKIKLFIEKEYNFFIGYEEQIYLTIHIQRLANYTK